MEIKLTKDKTVRQFRWVMAGVILFSILITLLGQPYGFWQHPETAVRGDGLSIYNSTNHTFEFFLGMGWQIYLITSLIYLFFTLGFVSILPRRIALIAIFSFILAYYFGATNWLANRWHLGVAASSIYGLVLSILIVFFAFSNKQSVDDRIIKYLFMLMIAVMLCDVSNTLIGQPASYWSHPESVHEANMISRYFLSKGWYAYILLFLIYFIGIYFLITILPRSWSLICIFYFILVDYIGGSNWFFYEWRMGMQTPVIFSMVISIFLVVLAFPKSTKLDSKNLLLNDSS